jgi:hypothetical protein
MEFDKARQRAVKVEQNETAIKGLLKQIGPYGEIDVISMLLKDLNRLGTKKMGLDVMLIDELRWPKNVARKLIKESGVK